MAVTILQQVGINLNSGSVNSPYVVAPITVSAGSNIHIFTSRDDNNSTSTLTISDSQNGAYTRLSEIDNNVSTGLFTGSFYVLNVAAGTPNITFTLSIVENADFFCQILEIGGADTTDAPAGASELQNPAVTGTDGLTSGTAAVTTQPALIIGFTEDAAAQFGAGTTSPGTGFASVSTFPGQTESKTTNVTTPQAGTWTTTATTAGVQCTVIYLQPGGGGGGTQPITAAFFPFL